MQMPEVISEFLRWRWAPCVGLTTGSLAFVAISLLLIPTQFSAPPAPVAGMQRSSYQTASIPNPRALYGASLAQSSPEFAQPARQPETLPPVRSLPAPALNTAASARGFSPIAERPAEPQQPVPDAQPAQPVPPQAMPAPPDSPAPQ